MRGCCCVAVGLTTGLKQREFAGAGTWLADAWAVQECMVSGLCWLFECVEGRVAGDVWRLCARMAGTKVGFAWDVEGKWRDAWLEGSM